MSKVNERNYITVQGWMVDTLGLKGNELLIYAIIYGFSQSEGQRFTGSLQYLADWTNSSKKGVLNSLKGLLDKGYIDRSEKAINGVKFVEYWVTEFHSMEKSSIGYGTNFHGGMEQSSTNNIDINNIDNNIDSKRFKKPSVEEVKAYCKERNNHIDAEKFVNYYESNGWKVGKNPMRNWKACIRTWEKNNFQSSSKKQQSVPDYMLNTDYNSEEEVDTSDTQNLLRQMKGIFA